MSDENRKAASLTFAFPGGELSITLNDQVGQRLLKRVLPIVQAYTPNLYAILLTHVEDPPAEVGIPVAHWLTCVDWSD